MIEQVGLDALQITQEQLRVAALATQHVQASIGGNPHQPTFKAAPRSVIPQLLVRGKKNFLRHFFHYFPA